MGGGEGEWEKGEWKEKEEEATYLHVGGLEGGALGTLITSRSKIPCSRLSEEPTMHLCHHVASGVQQVSARIQLGHTHVYICVLCSEMSQ